MIYEGGIKNGIEHGKGFERTLAGSEYKGEFENGLRQGLGR